MRGWVENATLVRSNGSLLPLFFPERAGDNADLTVGDVLRAGIGVDLTPVAVFGSPEACVEGVRQVVDAGAEMVLCTPLHDEAGQMERLAAEVVAQVA